MSKHRQAGRNISIKLPASEQGGGEASIMSKGALSFQVFNELLSFREEKRGVTQHQEANAPPIGQQDLFDLKA